MNADKLRAAKPQPKKIFNQTLIHANKTMMVTFSATHKIGSSPELVGNVMQVKG